MVGLLSDMGPEGVAETVQRHPRDAQATPKNAEKPTQRDRKVQRSVDHAIYRQRNLVERYFNKLKHFRRIATRFEKLAVTYLAAVALASARIWTRAYESTT